MPTSWGVKDVSAYISPKCVPEVLAKTTTPFRIDAPQTGQTLDVYPFLGVGRAPADLIKPGAVPPVVCGASVPQCGARSLKYEDAFVHLSAELAIYGCNRTSAIMKGARAGC